MRFLNTTTLQFEYVLDYELSEEKNKYAILSHRWGRDEDEITYEDMTSSVDLSYKPGFIKVTEFCNLAFHSGFRYAWVDTCCINKGNSSELAEAINSMYLWYKLSTLCVVYLEDVPEKLLEGSEWFDRGWTLQELIAPRSVSFFNKHWEPIGTKLELLESLAQKTGIPKDVLGNVTEPWSCSIAQRMSWAAGRVTKRVEDRAYSLLGLFEVNMPMIYGEREKAFLRLQQQIVRMSKDESLFAWETKHDLDPSKPFFSIYASDPCAFLNCGSIVTIPGSSGFEERNGELIMTLPCCRYTPGILDIFLHCMDKAKPKNRSYITISKVFREETYVRIRDVGVFDERQSPLGGNQRTMRFPVNPRAPPVVIFYGFWLRTLEPPGYQERNICISSASPAIDPTYIQQKRKGGITGLVRLQSKHTLAPFVWSEIAWIVFGFDNENNPQVWLANDTFTDKFQVRPVPEQDPVDQPKDGDEVCMRKTHEITRSEEFFRNNRDVLYEWPEGRARIPVDRKKGLHEFSMPNLNLQVSVRLHPCQNPAVRLLPYPIKHIDEEKQTPDTTFIWVVDITPSPECRPPLPRRVIQKTNWENWLCIVVFCPVCALCGCSSQYIIPVSWH